MKYKKLLQELLREIDWGPVDDENPPIKFEGIKWQEENHPSAQVFPIELIKVSSDKASITIRFVTKPHPAP